MEIAPIVDSFTESGEDRETSIVRMVWPPACEDVHDADVVHQDDPAVVAIITTMERHARNEACLARIAEVCNAAADESALYQAVTDEAARWMHAAAFAIGADVRAFATRDAASENESAVVPVFHVAAHQLTGGTPYIHCLREIALAAPLGEATAAAGYHTLALAPV